MKVVRCARCGHENRAAISLSICDQCGSDISTLPDLNQGANELDLRMRVDEFVVTEAPTPAIEQPPAPPPASPASVARPSLAWIVLAFVCRMLVAAVAVGAGVGVGLSFAAGTALKSDEYVAGSIAILAAAAAISGLIMILVGGGRERSHRITLGMRALGLLLATLGVWAVTTIARVSLRDERATTPPVLNVSPMVGPGPMLGRPGGLIGAGAGYPKEMRRGSTLGPSNSRHVPALPKAGAQRTRGGSNSGDRNG